MKIAIIGAGLTGLVLNSTMRNFKMYETLIDFSYIQRE